MVRIDDTPLWVRSNAIEAIHPAPYPNDAGTQIILTSGHSVYTDKLSEDVMRTLVEALRNTQPTFGGKP